MARPRKPPAILVEATVRRSPKLAALPSDTARLGFFFAVLAEAKLADPPGQFASAAHFREVAGRFGRYLDDYTQVGVLETAPKLCSKCAPHWSAMPPRRGALVVHDWHEHQYDPRKIERQREYEERQKDAQSDRVSDEVSDAQSDEVSDAITEEFPTPISRAPVTPARRDRVGNVERRTSNESPSGEDSSHRRRERADIAALHDRGWKRVTKAQRAVLDEILSRHDVTGAEFAAEAIRSAGPAADPLEAALIADRAWQEARRRRADADEAQWTTTKAAERAESNGRLAQLIDDEPAWMRDEAKA